MKVAPLPVEVDPDLLDWLDSEGGERRSVLVRLRRPVEAGEVDAWESRGVFPAAGAVVATAELDRVTLRSLLQDPQVEAITSPPRMYPRVR